ncbi:MAG: DUF4139 domain-containing protein [Planctomycetes bacterium]|nr:DUF4139 domain-containing protein [Planctomycetota bacterium]
MRSQRILQYIVSIVALAAGAAMAEMPAGAASPGAAGQGELPIRKVVLFSSGVGYFEHTGRVSDDATIELRFKTNQINDLLKSLVLEDMDGGRVGTVVYPSQDPIAKTLRSFQVDISANPSLGELLNQLRGANVSVEVHGRQLEGTILGVEQKKTIVGKDNTITVWVLNLISGGSIRSVSLEDVQNLELQDEELQAELARALAALAQARDQDKKPVTIEFTGQGERRVRLAYVVETPIWKTSYRLIMPPSDGAPAKLQGWAIVENQTDSDWENIQLSLVSGRPISFVQNLYQPLYIPRPTVQPQLYASLTPQTYEAGIDWDKLGTVALPFTPATTMWTEAHSARLESMLIPGVPSEIRLQKGWAAGVPPIMNPLDATASVASAAAAGDIGELFQYVVGDVSLPRHKSAMIPIVTDDIEVTRVSIYNQSVLAKHPLNGARMKNTTGKHLLHGPITVFDDHAYAGDARIDNLPPDQERLLSYAIDLQVRVDATKNETTHTIQTVKIAKGVMQIFRKYVHEQEYLIKNESDREKIILVEHHLRPGWELVDSPKPIETTETLYRFENIVSAGETSKLAVKQEKVQAESIRLLNNDVGSWLIFTQTNAIPEKVRVALSKAIALKNKADDTQREVRDTKSRIASISSEQSRIRSNMGAVNRNSDYYNRLMKKLDDQESQIEQHQAELAELEETYQQQRKAFEDYLSELEVG